MFPSRREFESKWNPHTRIFFSGLSRPYDRCCVKMWTGEYKNACTFLKPIWIEVFLLSTYNFLRLKVALEKKVVILYGHISFHWLLFLVACILLYMCEKKTEGLSQKKMKEVMAMFRCIIFPYPSISPAFIGCDVMIFTRKKILMVCTLQLYFFCFPFLLHSNQDLMKTKNYFYTDMHTYAWTVWIEFC